MQALVTSPHRTPLGDLWSTWTAHGLLRFGWEKPDRFDPRVGDDARPIDPEEVEAKWVAPFCELLDCFFETGCETFRSIPVDPTGWSTFHRRIYARCREIDPGTTATYKRLAELSGKPRAFRAVGTAMAKNRTLLVIPCHRVIAASGKLRGFSAPGGLETKRKLLELERRGCWSAEAHDSSDVWHDTPVTSTR